MRKKMMLLVLSLAVLVGALWTAPVQASDGYACPICTTLSNGSQCCIPCWCQDMGRFQVQTCSAIGCDVIEP